MPLTGQQVTPDHYMPVFHLSEPSIDAALPWIRFGLGENAVQKGCIRLILPMVLEGVNVGNVTL